jgi:hypothetical protein
MADFFGVSQLKTQMQRIEWALTAYPACLKIFEDALEKEVPLLETDLLKRLGCGKSELQWLLESRPKLRQLLWQYRRLLSVKYQEDLCRRARERYVDQDPVPMTEGKVYYRALRIAERSADRQASIMALARVFRIGPSRMYQYLKSNPALQERVKRLAQ